MTNEPFKFDCWDRFVRSVGYDQPFRALRDFSRDANIEGILPRLFTFNNLP